MKTKERILLGALDLFNKFGATEVTTNDIARELKMSPGNLYFHYKNKEQIVRELFKRLALETTTVWKPETRLAKRNKENFHLMDFIDSNLHLHWKYRFFHREMYTLRKKDHELSKLWKKHLKKINLMMILLYKHWSKAGYMLPIKSKYEMEFIAESLFIASSSFMQFFETAERGDVLNQKTFEKARKHLMHLLKPYLSVQAQDNFEKLFKT